MSLHHQLSTSILTTNTLYNFGSKIFFTSSNIILFFPRITQVFSPCKPQFWLVKKNILYHPIPYLVFWGVVFVPPECPRVFRFVTQLPTPFPGFQPFAFKAKHGSPMSDIEGSRIFPRGRFLGFSPKRGVWGKKNGKIPMVLEYFNKMESFFLI